MRTVSAVRKLITDQVDQEIDSDRGNLTARDLFDVELALHLLATVAPGQTVQGAVALLDGHGGERRLGAIAPDDAIIRISNARVAIGRSLSVHRWEDLVRAYRVAPHRVRGYDIDDEGVHNRVPFCSLAPERFDVYERLLTEPLPFTANRSTVATAGVHKVVSASGRQTVTIPGDFPFPPASTGYTAGLRSRSTLCVRWEELASTAAEMDRVDAKAGRSQSWETRIRDTELLVRTVDDSFVLSGSISIDGLLHMVGMVSAGKTTLIQVLGVWAAKTDQRVTIVLGDNAAVLDMVSTLNDYVPACAAPILGGSGRERHLGALHKRKPFTDGTLRLADTSGFEWASTGCALAALLPDSDRLTISEAPCEDLVEYNEQDKNGDRPWPEGARHVCPFWHKCQRHTAARGLVDAPIWVATHWGLTHTSVPAPLSSERMRYLEAAWRRSDLFLVDEVDRVQTGLDEVFAAGHMLFGSGKEAWVDEVFADVDARLRETGHAARRHRHVRAFTEHLSLAKGLGGILYSLLQRDARHGGDTLADWMGSEFFTSWTLAEKMARELSGYDPRTDAPESEADPPRAYEQLRAGFHAYIDEPSHQARQHSDPVAASVAELNHYLLVRADEEERFNQVRSWIEDNLSGVLETPVVAGLDIEASTMRLELLLTIALFTYYLSEVRYAWPAASRVLELTTHHPRQSPADLRPLVPEAPMGTALGFQYLAPNGPEVGESAGDLHFFEATGIGRSLLLDLPLLFPAEGRGPNAIFLSGTSWAGTSPRYDVDVKVDAILKPSDEILAGIEKSRFEVLTLHDPRNQRAIRVSGKQGDERTAALRQMVGALTRPSSDGTSRLEKIRQGLREERKKILLIVGSYAEAKTVHDALIRSTNGYRVRYLLADDAGEDSWSSMNGEALRRSKVAEFGTSGDDILVAPLLAIERGHNILNRERVAAIGAALFLVRPHPSPQDIAWVTQSLNRVAISRRSSIEAPRKLASTALADMARRRRREAQLSWRELLRKELVYSRLANDPVTRDQLIWTQIVTIWQVIGRLVRGGQDAEVYFCDAAFVPGATAKTPRRDTANTSLLLGMREVLDTYCGSGATDPNRHLVTALYGPLYRALTNLKGI